MPQVICCSSHKSLSLSGGSRSLHQLRNSPATHSRGQATLWSGSSLQQQHSQEGQAGTERSGSVTGHERAARGCEGACRPDDLNPCRMVGPQISAVSHVLCGLCPAVPSQTPLRWPLPALPPGHAQEGSSPERSALAPQLLTGLCCHSPGKLNTDMSWGSKKAQPIQQPFGFKRPHMSPLPWTNPSAKRPPCFTLEIKTSPLLPTRRTTPAPLRIPSCDTARMLLFTLALYKCS